LRGFLLDTNVLSELRLPRPHPSVVQYLSAQPEETLFVSDITFAEIRFGIERSADAERRAELAAWLAQTLRPLFEGRRLGVTEDVLVRWRLAYEAGRRRGHTFGPLDLFIAATADEFGLIVVSRDPTHFLAAGVAHLDPWTGVCTGRHARERRAVDDLDSEDLLERLSAWV
jgi:toxin FitB